MKTKNNRKDDKLYSSIQCLFLSGLMFLFAIPLSAQVFVNLNAGGANDGSSWEDAYVDLQMALDSALANEQIWVTGDVYLPTLDSMAKDQHFHISKPLKIYGGFKGTEDSLEERSGRISTLSGDVLGNDFPKETARKTDNVYRVVVVDSTFEGGVFLDRFQILGGHAVDSLGSYKGKGGGILSFNRLHLMDCFFDNNVALKGGAIYFAGDTLQVIEAFLEENTAEVAAGIYAENQATLNFYSIEIQDNKTTKAGATMCIHDHSSIFMTDFRGEHNEGVDGGVLSMIGDSIDVELVNGNLLQNYAGNIGGGICFKGSGRLLIDDCNLESNAAKGNGGSIYLEEKAFDHLEVNLNAIYCILNLTAGYGGAIYNSGSDMKVVNSAFVFNLADTLPAVSSGRGGALYNEAHLVPLTDSTYLADTANILLLNNNFIENDCNLDDGHISQSEEQQAGFSAKVICHLQNNIIFKSDDIVSYFYRAHEGSPDVISLGGNITFTHNFSGSGYFDNSINPYLINPADWVNIDPKMSDPLQEDFYLMYNSPVRHAGVRQGAPAVDINGNFRGRCISIGAYESSIFSDPQVCPIRNVTSIGELEAMLQLRLHPNPVRSETELFMEGALQGRFEWHVIDMLGRELATGDFEKWSLTQSVPMDFGDLPQGVYQLIVEQEGQQTVIALTK